MLNHVVNKNFLLVFVGGGGLFIFFKVTNMLDFEKKLIHLTMPNQLSVVEQMTWKAKKKCWNKNVNNENKTQHN